MRITDLTVICPYCNQEFRLFSDDGKDDSTICWNFCPHCGKRVDLWLRFIDPESLRSAEIFIGLGAEDAANLRKDLDAKHKKEASKNASY